MLEESLIAKLYTYRKLARDNKGKWNAYGLYGAWYTERYIEGNKVKYSPGQAIII